MADVHIVQAGPEDEARVAELARTLLDELYVAPEIRSDGVGAALLDALCVYGREKGWSRLELTAPAGEQWARTVRFYEREGFVFTGPQMKLRLK